MYIGQVYSIVKVVSIVSSTFKYNDAYFGGAVMTYICSLLTLVSKCLCVWYNFTFEYNVYNVYTIYNILAQLIITNYFFVLLLFVFRIS